MFSSINQEPTRAAKAASHGVDRMRLLARANRVGGQRWLNKNAHVKSRGNALIVSMSVVLFAEVYMSVVFTMFA